MKTTSRKPISWEGDALEVLSSFPNAVKEDLGFGLHRLQIGEHRSDFWRMKSIGAGVFELKESDDRGWYRVIYFTKVKDMIYVLHCFEKQSRKTSRTDLEKAETRLRKVLERIRNGKK